MHGFPKKRGYLSGKLGQIWIETVIYTLIAFSIMGLVLAFVIPKIQESQDKATLDQSVAILQNIDTTIGSMGDPGNQRVVSLGISKGTMTVDAPDNQIFFVVDSRAQYSEPGKIVNVGKIGVDTETKNDAYTVTLTLNYSGEYNITYLGSKQIQALSSSSVPYSFSISNKGKDSSGETIIDTGVVG